LPDVFKHDSTHILPLLLLVVDWVFESVVIALKVLHNEAVNIKSDLFNIIMYIAARITKNKN